MAKRLSKVNVKWSHPFAYAIGILATDGNLSPDGRHLNVTSKDEELVTDFKQSLCLGNKIGRKARGGSDNKKYFVIQFGDKNFYNFLLDIGLKPAKSKTLGEIKLPKEYFADFLRGCLDGDGNIDIHNHPESQHLQLRTRFCCASLDFLNWLKSEITQQVSLNRGWIENYSRVYILSYGKADSIQLLKFVYYPNASPYLERKYLLAKPFLQAQSK